MSHPHRNLAIVLMFISALLHAQTPDSATSAQALPPTGSPTQAEKTTEAATRPNVLLIIVDDLNARISPLDDQLAITPNLDRLAARGVTFDRAYVQQPLCHPSRSSMLSGKYPTSIGVLDNETFLIVPEGQHPLQHYFAAQGYNLAEFGKIWHLDVKPRHGDMVWVHENALDEKLSYPGKKRKFRSPAQVAKLQVDEPDYWEHNISPYRQNRVPNPKKTESRFSILTPLPDGREGIDAETREHAVDSMRAMAADERPFFLAVGFKKPHVPLQAPKRYYDLYDVEKMPLPPDFATEPTLAANVPEDAKRLNLDLFTNRSFTKQEAKEAIRAYYACISYIDDQIGHLLDELDALGVADNTIIALWSDHGFHLSEKGMWAKGTLFEMSARSPLIIVDPRLPQSAGKHSSRTVEAVDIYPTLTDLAGIPTPDYVEGDSLRPLLENPDAAWDKAAFTVQPRLWHIGRTIRTDRWRYTEWNHGERGYELYDATNDPHEMNNLADDPEFASVRDDLAKQLRNGPINREPWAGK